MKKFVFSLSLFCVLSTFSQNSYNVKDFSKFVDTLDLKKSVYYLASESMKGRFTGEEGQKQAASFIKSQFASFGLKSLEKFPNYTQSFTLKKSSPNILELSINGNKLVNNQDFLFAGELNMEKKLSESSKYIDFKNINNTTKDNVYGKTVFVDQSFLNSKAYMKLSQMQPLAVFVLLENSIKNFNATYKTSGDLGGEKEPYLTHLDEKERSKLTPLFYIDKSVWSKVLNGKRKNKFKVDFVVQRKEEIVETENVLGFIEGSESKDEFIVISAHYDHIGFKDKVIWYGADDNASGVAAVLELAKAFTIAKRLGHAPKKSILFVAFTGEEQRGMLGSTYFVKESGIKINQIITNLNIDGVGRIAPEYFDFEDYVYLIGSDKISKRLHDLSEDCNKKYVNLTLDYTYNEDTHPEQVYYRSDQWSFAQHGIPVIFYFGGLTDDYHMPTDTADKINYKTLKKRTQLVFYTAYFLGMGHKL